MSRNRKGTSMNIVATKLPDFEEIVIKFLEKGKDNILNQLSLLLEQIDDKLSLRRHKSLKIIKFQQRSILTDFGVLTFKRRYYLDTDNNEYLYLLDTKLKIPKRVKVLSNIKLRVIEAASEMSYSKAGYYAGPQGYPLSKSTVYRYIKDACIYVKPNNFIKDNADIIHVQIDEKFLHILGNKRKKKYVTATIFKGRKYIGKKSRIKLENRTILSAKNEKLIFEKINKTLEQKYKINQDDEIYLSGDFAQYIQQSESKIYVCRAKYIPDKYHLKSAMLKETGFVATDNDLKDPDCIAAVIESLKDCESVDGIKLRTFLKKNPGRLKEYSNPSYLGCSQEGMNSHYYASRFGKLPMKIGMKNLQVLTKLIEAKQNNSEVKIGFVNEYYIEPTKFTCSMWNLEEEKFVLDTRGMEPQSRKVFEHIKYGC